MKKILSLIALLLLSAVAQAATGGFINMATTVPSPAHMQAVTFYDDGSVQVQGIWQGYLPKTFGPRYIVTFSTRQVNNQNFNTSFVVDASNSAYINMPNGVQDWVWWQVTIPAGAQFMPGDYVQAYTSDANTLKILATTGGINPPVWIQCNANSN